MQIARMEESCKQQTIMRGELSGVTQHNSTQLNPIQPNASEPNSAQLNSTHAFFSEADASSRCKASQSNAHPAPAAWALLPVAGDWLKQWLGNASSHPQLGNARILPSLLQTFPILISVKDPPKHIVSDHHSPDYIQLRVCVQHNCPAETHDHFPHIASSAKVAAHSAAHAGGGTWYGAARRELGPK